MEVQTIFKEDHTAPLSNNYLKHEHAPEPEADMKSEDDFSIQDLTQLTNLSLTGPSFHPDYGINVSGFDSFAYGSGLADLELMSFELENGCGIMQDCRDHESLTHISKTFVGLSELDNFMNVGDPTRDYIHLGTYVPDEGSCVMGENGFKKYDGETCKGKAKRKTNSSKGQWSKEEDRVLKQLVEKHGERKWSCIAQVLKGRIGKQCRERWHNHLRSNIKKDFWTEDEDRILITTHARLGNKWSEIAKMLPGRTENSVKNHWNATKRRQYTTRKCRSKWPKPSLILQNYMKSLNLPRGKSSTNKADIDNTLTIDQHEFYSSDKLMMPDFDFNEVPEFALDGNLLQESFLDDMSLFNHIGERKHT